MRRARAFTLVELLVVISIIGLLISLLLPSLGRTRDAAMRVRCATMYRQIGVGSFSYAADSQDAVPWLGGNGGFGMLGLGGPFSAAGIPTDILCKFSESYMNASWSYNNVTGLMNVPNVLVDPGLALKAVRPYGSPWGMTSTPLIGQWNSLGSTVGFGTILGMYTNNTSPDRSGTGSNSGVNMRWRMRNPVYTNIIDGSDGLALLRFQDMVYPNSDVIFLDLLYCNSANGSAATAWSVPHGSFRPDGANHGYADGSVRWTPYSTFNTIYQVGEPWAFSGLLYTPLAADLTRPASLNSGGYPNAGVSFAPTTPNWFGVTTPHDGTFIP